MVPHDPAELWNGAGGLPVSPYPPPTSSLARARDTTVEFEHADSDLWRLWKLWHCPRGASTEYC
jgi:hypothetical protein